eukprot:2865111-Pleurochrysis_carterae.AAC.1
MDPHCGVNFGEARSGCIRSTARIALRSGVFDQHCARPACEADDAFLVALLLVSLQAPVGRHTNVPIALRLAGVGLGDFGSGLGEASALALSQFYPDPRRTLSAWSCGTGLAGVLGYLVAQYVMPQLMPGGFAGRFFPYGPIMFGLVLVASYWATFFGVIGAPWIDALRGAARGEAESQVPVGKYRCDQVPVGGALLLCDAEAAVLAVAREREGECERGRERGRT